MQYQLMRDSLTNLENDSVIKRTSDEGDNLFVPRDPSNRHWQEYQAWLADGNEPQPAEE